ncbi:MAG: hypothetical protein H6Q49_1601 [Deltaproteobacteria bacterium]|jgi:hypothetical protein|nr:hypothetical protein [Deltaproteobacteria bacterium]
MKSLSEITKEELIGLENRCWMTHDGMWFFSCLSNFGIEQANKLNKSAIKGLAPFEIDRTKKTIGYQKEKMESFQEFKDYFTMAKILFIPPFMNATMSFPEENVLHWEFAPGQCFAYKGMKRIGAIDQYECGVIYRIECWLDCLGIKHKIVPKIDKCLMHTTRKCSGEIELDFS